MPEVFSYATPGLKFRWLISMNQREGPWPRLCNGKRNIAVTWKPIGWWVKEPFGEPDYRQVEDSFNNPAPAKSRHEWEQHERWAEYCIENFTDTGDVVLDPFVGSGTIVAVAVRMGRRGVGIEIDKETARVARERIEDEYRKMELSDV